MKPLHSSPDHPARKRAREDYAAYLTGEGEKDNPYDILTNMPAHLAYEDEWESHAKDSS